MEIKKGQEPENTGDADMENAGGSLTDKAYAGQVILASNQYVAEEISSAKKAAEESAAAETDIAAAEPSTLETDIAAAEPSAMETDIAAAESAAPETDIAAAEAAAAEADGTVVEASSTESAVLSDQTASEKKAAKAHGASEEKDAAQKKNFFEKKNSEQAEDYSLPSRKASFRKKVDELKQIDYKEKLESLKESGAATKETIIKTTQDFSQTEAGKKVILKTRSAEHFFKTRKGKRMIRIAVLLLLVLIGLVRWHAGADLREGIRLCESGDYVDAQTPLLNAVAKDNMNPKAYNALGFAYLGSEEYPDAIKQFELAQNLDEDNQDAFRGLGIAYYKTGDYESAVSALDKALDKCGININNKEYDIMWYRGDCECALRDYDSAVYTYSALMELEGDSALVRYYRGNIYCLMGDKEKAMEDFDAAIAMEGNGYDLFFDIYNSMVKAGWSEEANAYLDKTMEPGVIDADAVGDSTQKARCEGMVYYLEGDYETALKRFSQSDLSQDFESQCYAGLCYEKLGKQNKALSLYKALVAAYPNKAEAYNALALYMMRRGEYKKAVSYLNKGIENCPAADQEVLYYNMVTAYESKGNMEAALEALRQYGVIYGQSSIAHEKAFVKERDRS